MKCGIGRGKSWEWANTRKSYWRTSKSPILTRAITNENLRLAGYPSLSAYYAKLYRN
ncbi:MAG: hypothetical protein ACK5L5_10705 [Bacteroidales bacterium]